MGTKDDAFGPGMGEAVVVIGMEVGEEVSGGVGGGGVVAEGVDEEAGVRDEFGGRERGGNWGKREGEIGRV